MWKLFSSWMFFTALLLFLLTAAVTVPHLASSLMGTTPAQVDTVLAEVKDQVQDLLP
jgi:hypothetical protein